VIERPPDSLRYCTAQTHLDGFRFDLGTILARKASGSTTKAVFRRPVVRIPSYTIKLIAEARHCGPGGYPVDASPD